MFHNLTTDKIKRCVVMCYYVLLCVIFKNIIIFYKNYIL